MKLAMKIPLALYEVRAWTGGRNWAKAGITVGTNIMGWAGAGVKNRYWAWVVNWARAGRCDW